MNNEENNNRPPRRGPGHGPGAVEKPKDFKTSISKLFKSLGSFKIFILIALILAMGGAILSLSAPNKLSDLTDEIQKGIVLNTSNLKKLTNDITDELKSDDLKNRYSEILNIKMDNETITKIMSSDNVSMTDKLSFQNSIQNMNKENMMNTLLELPDSIQNIILENTEYKGEVISTDDKRKLLSMMTSGMDEKSLNDIPNSIKKVLLSDSKISGQTITSEEKFEFLEKFIVENCVKILYKGNPLGLQEEVTRLEKYLKEKNLKPKSAGYNVLKRQEKEIKSFDEFETEIYLDV